jgi:MtN3 and saliva related transmembrane protein
MLKEVVGILTIVLTVASFTPQVWKAWRTKSVNDLSWWMIIIYALAALAWTWYGVILKDVMIITTDVLVFLQTFALLLLKLKYQK